MSAMEVISQILEVILAAVLPILAVYVAQYLKALVGKYLAEAEAQYPDIFSVVEMVAAQVVAAAEQAGAAGFIDSKIDYALELAEKWLAEYDFDIDLDLIRAAIEAEVKRQFGK